MPTTKRQKPSRPLTCHRCGSRAVRVSESAQMRLGGGSPRLHADVRCAKCKGQWWSRHPDAIAQSRALDKAAKERNAPTDAEGAE
jgi:hypothetical protein